MDFKYRLLTSVLPGRGDPFWYEGVCADLEYEGRHYELLACGEPKVAMSGRDGFIPLKNIHDEAVDDAGLANLVGHGGESDRPYYWIDQNWFEVVDIEGGSVGRPQYNLTDAIQELKRCAVWDNTLTAPDK